MKTKECFSLKDENLRNQIFVKYNYKSLKFNCNSFFDSLDKNELIYESTFQKIEKEFKSISNTEDKLIIDSQFLENVEEDDDVEETLLLEEYSNLHENTQVQYVLN